MNYENPDLSKLRTIYDHKMALEVNPLRAFKLLENPLFGINLSPPKNLRSTTPRVCATCRCGYVTGGAFSCIRPNGFSGDATSMSHYENVCDRWESE